MRINQLKRGDFFTLRKIEFPTEMQVWVRGDYDRAAKKYECFLFGDLSRVRLFPGAKEIHTDFVF